MSNKILAAGVKMIPNDLREVSYASTGKLPNIKEILKEHENTEGDDGRTSPRDNTKDSE